MIPHTHKEFIASAAEILKKDYRFAGVAVGGSYSANAMDEYSDIDFVIGVYPEYYEEVMLQRKSIAGNLGSMAAAFTGEHVGEPRLVISLFKNPVLHVDIKFVELNHIHIRVEDPMILWEREGALSREFEKSHGEFPIPELQWIEDRFWVWIHYAATKLGREEIFETIEFISFLRQTVIGPLMLMKNGKLPRGVRRIEVDAPEYFEKLKETIVVYDKNSCINALEKIVELYRELREYFIANFTVNKEAEKVAMEYLNTVK